MKQLAYLFPGQGSQAPGMGKTLYQQSALARLVFEEASDSVGRDLAALCFDSSEEELKRTGNSQLALFVVSIATFKAFSNHFPSLTPIAVAGHSLGEYSALVASGRLSLDKAAKLVKLRSQLMEEACNLHPGAMVAVLGSSEAELHAITEQPSFTRKLFVANLNSPGQIIMSGTKVAVELFCLQSKELGVKKVIPLSVQGAFHSPLMQSAEDLLMPSLQALSLKESKIAQVMNSHGGWVEKSSDLLQALFQQITRPVQWIRTMETLQQKGISSFLELGCGKTLAGLAKRMQLPCLSLESLDDFRQIETSL